MIYKSACDHSVPTSRGAKESSLVVFKFVIYLSSSSLFIKHFIDLELNSNLLVNIVQAFN